MDTLGVGVIGTGRISDLHAIEYRRNPHTRIVALCDRDPELAAGRRRAWGVPGALITTDYHELLALEAVDLVEILLPHHLHAPAALAAFAAGKAVSLQKPMTTTLADADRLVAAAEHAGVPFRVFENFIFYPPVMCAKELVDAGAIGEPLTIRIQEQPRQPQVRLGRARRRSGVAPEPLAVGRRAAGVRRRPPQVRPGLALHGTAGGGARLDRLYGRRRRLRVRRPRDDLVPLRRPALRQTWRWSTRPAWR